MTRSMIIPVVFILFLVAGAAVENLAVEKHKDQGYTQQQTERMLKVYN